MIHEKTKSLAPSTVASNYFVGSMLMTVQHGLTQVLTAVENYATSFEALGGMIGE